MKNLHLIPFGLALIAANMAFAADEIHYTITGNNSVTFDWRGTAEEKTISYGVAPGAYSQVQAKALNPVANSPKNSLWEAKLTGLKVNTLYYYSIGNSPERTFRTAPSVGSSGFTVYAEGDIGDTSHFFNTGAVQDLIADGHPAFVLGLGDLAMSGINGKDAVDQHFNDVMTWSKEAAYMPVWGDQDWRKGGSNNFKNIKSRFDLPNPQASPGTPTAGGKDWYWFDYGNVRFIALPESWAGAWSDWKNKADALMAKAQADGNIKFIVTMVHRPAYSSGHFSGATPLKSILNALGDRHSKYVLNLNAHSGNYERSYPQHGVVHVTAGTGGSDLKQDGACLWLTCAKPAWSAFRTMHHGVVKLNFTANGIEGSFICGPNGGGKNDLTCVKGSVVDSFTIAPSAVSGKAATKKKATKPNSGVIMKAAAVSSASCTKKSLNMTSVARDGGYAYKINGSFGVKPDNYSSEKSQTQSTLRLFENDVEIGPAHSYHSSIRNTGLGKYTHWSRPNGTLESIRFSATDNTNPKTNGKRYAYCLNGTGTQAQNDTTTGNTTTGNTTTGNTTTGNTTTGNTTSTTPSTSSSCAASPSSSLVVNVKDKGAKGNGSDNDTAAIQAAINQVAGTGGTVLVPDGTYMVNTFSRRLFIKSNMTFRMSDKAVIKAIPTDSGSYSVLRVENVSKVNVIGGKLQGDRYQHQGTSGQNGYGVAVIGASDVVVEDVIATDMWGDGFYIGKQASNVRVCSVTADNNRRQGMSITDVNGAIVKNSTFKNSNGSAPEAGIQLEPNQNETVNNVKIINSQSLNNKGYGIKLTIPNQYLAGSAIKNVTLDSNTITGSKLSAVFIAKTSGHTVTNNTVKNNSADGIDLVAGASNNVVTGNNVADNGGSSNIGILMWDRATSNTVTKNTVSGHGKANIRDGVGGNTISPNTVY